MEPNDVLPGQPPVRPGALDTIVLGGLTVAVLDISNAITFWALYRHVPPVRIFQSVAAGLLGRERAVAGGMSTALLGAGLHTFIAFGVATVFYAACRAWPALLRRPVAAGMLYGLVVFAVMNYGVIPLSRAAGGKHVLPWLAADLIGHALLVGLPVALVARWSARRHADRARPMAGASPKSVQGTPS